MSIRRLGPSSWPGPEPEKQPPRSDSEGEQPKAPAVGNGDRFEVDSGERRSTRANPGAGADDRVTFRPRRSRREEPPEQPPGRATQGAVPDGATAVPLSRALPLPEDASFGASMYEHASRDGLLRAYDLGDSYAMYIDNEFVNRLILTDHRGETAIFEVERGVGRVPKDWLDSRERWSAVAANYGGITGKAVTWASISKLDDL